MNIRKAKCKTCTAYAFERTREHITGSLSFYAKITSAFMREQWIDVGGNPTVRHEGGTPSNNLIKDVPHRATVFVGPTLKSLFSREVVSSAVERQNYIWRSRVRVTYYFFLRENYKRSYERKEITSIGRGQAVTSIKCGAGLSPVILSLLFF